MCEKVKCPTAAAPVGGKGLPPPVCLTNVSIETKKIWRRKMNWRSLHNLIHGMLGNSLLIISLANRLPSRLMKNHPVLLISAWYNFSYSPMV